MILREAKGFQMSNCRQRHKNPHQIVTIITVEIIIAFRNLFSNVVVGYYLLHNGEISGKLFFGGSGGTTG
jgi:hypothetical protein